MAMTTTFHWEREWRVPNGLVITPEEVPFILCPEGDILGLRKALEEELLDEWLDVPIVDATWSPERMVERGCQERSWGVSSVQSQNAPTGAPKGKGLQKEAQ